MVYENLFNFGTSNLVIKSLKDIPPNSIEDLNLLIKVFRSELNHNIKNSSASKFNDSNPNTPIFVKHEFIDYLQFNLDYSTQFGPQFNTFSLVTPSKYIEINKGAGIVLKYEEIEFDTSFFRSTYILEIIMNFFKEINLNDYLMGLNSIALASGKYAWETRFKESNIFSKKTFQLKSQSAILIEKEKLVKSESKFGARNNELFWEELIIIGNSPSYIKFVSDQLKTTASRHMLREYAKNYKVDLITIDENEKIDLIQGM